MPPRDWDHMQLAARRRRGVSITHQIDLGRVGAGGQQPQQHKHPHWGSRDTRQPRPLVGPAWQPRSIPRTWWGWAAGPPSWLWMCCRWVLGDRAGVPGATERSGQGAAVSGAGRGAAVLPGYPQPNTSRGPFCTPCPGTWHLPAQHPVPTAGVPLTHAQPEGGDGAATMGEIPAPARSPGTAVGPGKGMWWLPVSTGPRHSAMSACWGWHCRWHGRSGGSAWCVWCGQDPCQWLSPAVPSQLWGCQGADATHHPTRGLQLPAAAGGSGSAAAMAALLAWSSRERAGSRPAARGAASSAATGGFLRGRCDQEGKAIKPRKCSE